MPARIGCVPSTSLLSISGGVGRNRGPSLVCESGQKCVARQQFKPSFVNERASFESCRRTEVGRIELTPVSLCQRVVDPTQKVNGVDIPRSSNPPDHDMLLLALMMFMIDIGIAPTCRAQNPKVFGMWIDDGVLVQVDTRIGQLAPLVLRAREIEKPVIPPNEGCQVRKDRNLGVTVGVMRNGCAIYKDDIAVVDTQGFI